MIKDCEVDSHHDDACGSKVDAHTASLRREKEARDALVFIEFVDKGLPHINRSGPCQDKILEPLVLQDLLQNIQNLGELGITY